MLLKIKKGFYGKHTSLAEIAETVKQAPQVVNILSSTELKKNKKMSFSIFKPPQKSKVCPWDVFLFTR